MDLSGALLAPSRPLRKGQGKQLPLLFIRTLRPLIIGGLIKKKGLANFPEEINGEGVNKWKWMEFVMHC